MTFSIYPDTLPGTLADWSETQTEVVVQDGIFNVVLGSVNSLLASVFDGSAKFLGVQVESDPEMRPLKPMVSVAYAYRAGTVDGGGIGGSGTTNYIPKFTASTTLGNSAIYETGGRVGIGTTPDPDWKLYIYHDFNDFAKFVTSGGTGVYGRGEFSGVSGTGGIGVNGYSAWGYGDEYDDAVGVRGIGSRWGVVGSSQGVTPGIGAGILGLSAGNAYAGWFKGNVYVEGGNVGIGTSPADNLDVNGDIRVRGADIKDTGGTARITLTDNGSLTLNEDGGSASLTIATDGNVGIGTAPSYKLHVSATATTVGYFTSTSSSGSGDVLSSRYLGSAYENVAAVFGESLPWDGKGYGGYFIGGHRGVYGTVIPIGSSSYMGVLGHVSGGTGTNYGVYGSAWGGSLNYGVYYSGGLAGTGIKSCVVKTSQGPTLLYCQESPENWFEDFGEGQLENGKAHVVLDGLFLETVTIDGTNPMKVFVQLEGDCNGVYVSKGATGFDVIELKGGTSNVPFSYRIVAKRKGFEDRRLDYTAAGENDPYLYPEAAERMEKERIEKEGR